MERSMLLWRARSSSATVHFSAISALLYCCLCFSRGHRNSKESNKKLNLTLDRALISLPLHSVAVKLRLA